MECLLRKNTWHIGCTYTTEHTSHFQGKSSGNMHNILTSISAGGDSWHAVNIFSLSKTVQPNNNNSSHRLHDQQEWQKVCQRLFSTDDAQTKPNPMVLPNSWHSLCIFVHKSSYILCFVHNDSYIFWGCPFKRTLFTGNIYIAIYISVISFYPVFEPCPR